MTIAVLALIGLVVGLTGESYEDVFANCMLSLCLIPIGWAALRR